MTAHYLTIQATKPVQFASCGRVETSQAFRHPTRTLDSYVLLIGLQGKLEIQQESQVYTLTKGTTLLLKKVSSTSGFLIVFRLFPTTGFTFI